MVLRHPKRISLSLSFAVDHIVTKFLELGVVEVVDVVDFLEADETCITHSNLIDDAWPSELEGEHL